MRQPSIAVFAASFVSLAFMACEKESAPPSTNERPVAAPAAPAEDPAHARPGVRPGSHEDWCGEHQVPESLCTRCNPSLIAAFKATGDWCDEHRLPESQCLICNPDLKIERPPRVEGASP